MANLFNITWTPEMLASEEKRKQGNMLDNVGTMQGEIPKAASRYEHLGEIDLQDPVQRRKRLKQVIQQVKANFPKAELAERKAEVKALMDTWEKQIAREQAGAPQAIMQAMNEGAALMPEDMFGTDKQRERISEGKAIKLTLQQAQSILLREAKSPEEINQILQGKMTAEQLERAAALKTESYGDVPLKDKGPSVFHKATEKAEQVVGPIKGALVGAHKELLRKTQGAPVTPSKYPGVGEERDFIDSLLNIVETVPEGQDPKFMGSGGARLLKQQLLDPQEDPRFLGVPLKAAAKGFMRKPRDILDVAMAAKEGAKEGWDKPFEGGSFVTPLTQTIPAHYKKLAGAQARKELPGVPKKVWVKRAKELAEEYMRQDTGRWGMDNPLTMDLAGSVLLDPLTWASSGLLGAAKAGLGTTKLAAKLPKAAKTALTIGGGAIPGAIVGGVAGSMADEADMGMAGGALAGMGLKAAAKPLIAKYAGALRQMSHRPELHLLDADTAARMRLHEGGAEAYAQGLYKSAAQDVRAMNKLTPAERTALLDIAETEAIGAAEGMIHGQGKHGAAIARAAKSNPNRAKKLQKAWDAHKRSQIRHAAMRDAETGIGKKYADMGTGAEIRPATTVEDYVPRRGNKADDVFTEGAIKPEVGIDAGKKPTRAGVTPGSAHERKLADYQGQLDITERWAREWGETIPKAKRAHEIKKIGKLLDEKGYILTVKAKDAKKGVRGAELLKLKEQMAAAEKASGVKYVALDDMPLQGLGGSKKMSVGDVYRLVTGEAGDFTKGGALMAVPEPVAMRLAELAPVVIRGSDAVSNWTKYMNAYIRPQQRIWRALHTVAAPSFHVRNALSGFGLSTLAFGIKALNPKLQAAAVAASILGTAGQNPKALGLLKKIKWTTRNGEKTDLLTIWKAFEQSGLGGQLEARMASESLSTIMAKSAGKEGKTIGGAVSKGIHKASDAVDTVLSHGDIPYARIASPMYAGRATENYQHFVTFLGFLDDLTESGIARATDLSSKFSGNYMRLGVAEKAVLRDGFSFYAWSRFIAPLAVKQLTENPGRLANYVKLRTFVDRQNSPEGKPGWAAHAPFARDVTVMGSPESQPKPRPGYPGDKYNFSVQSWEDPVSMTVASLKQLLTAVPGVKTHQYDPDMIDSIAPVARLAVDFLTMTDSRTGKPAELDGLLGNYAYGMVERPSEIYMNLINLYLENGRPLEAVDMAKRWRAERDFVGLNRVIAELAGMDPEKAGVPGAIPGLSSYLQRGLRNIHSQKISSQKRGGRLFQAEVNEDF